MTLERLTGTPYSLERPLGRGGSGEVFLATHEQLGKRVAIKLLRPGLAGDSELLDRLRAEARLLARITHPSLAGVYDLGETSDGRTFFAMEYIEGENAADLVRRLERVPLAMACEIVAQLLDGLAAVHALGIVHRDVKPSNVIIGRDGRARIVDFGLAHRLGEPSTGLLGTPSYMAPEQILGETVSPAADLYAAAATLFTLLTGAPPFESNPLEKHLTEAPPTLSERLDRPVSTGLEALVAQALSKDPADRPPSATSMAADLRRIVHPEEATFQAPAAQRRRANVRELPTKFLGRESDLDRLAEMFADGDRLVTLIGPGGVGKTRLAKRHAALGVARYPETWFVDLTGARRASDVVSKVARVIGATLDARDEDAAIEELGRTLGRSGSMLLVLDNCEQATGAVASAATRWIDAAPMLRVLATSRERLGLPGERAFDVMPMPLEDGVRLFVDRARLVRTDWVATETEAPVVEAIVRALDGIPLAIELAAARMGVMSVATLLDRLGQRFELLASTNRGVPERQRTLLAAIDWSWSLLEPWEQSALAQCSVFRGGFTLGAAEAVLDLVGAPPVLDVIQRLRDKSLVFAQSSRDFPSEIRLGLYDSVREYAEAKLEERDTVTRRHAAYFLRQGEKWAEHLHTGSEEHVRRLALEVENLRAVHERAAPQDAFGAADILLTILRRTSAPVSVQLELASSALDDAGVDADASVVGNLLYSRAVLWQIAGSYEKAHADAERLLALALASGRAVTKVQAHIRLQDVAAFTGASQKDALSHAELAVHAAREVDEGRWRRRALVTLAHAQFNCGQHDSAHAAFVETAMLAEAAHDVELLAIARSFLGLLAMERGNLGEAERNLEEVTRVGGLTSLEAKYNLATIRHERGDHERAATAYREIIAHGAQHRMICGLACGALGALLAARDAVEEAKRFFDEARSTLDGAGDAFSIVVATHLGHLDLALARRAAREGDEAGSETHRASAARRAKDAAEAATRSVDDLRTALRWLERALEPNLPQAADAWVLAADGSWFRRPHGWRVEMGSRAHAKGVLVALLRARLAQPGRAMSVDDVLAAGWPGERVLRRAAEARVYNIIKALRSAGLRDLIVSGEAGYLMDPAQRVVEG